MNGNGNNNHLPQLSQIQSHSQYHRDDHPHHEDLQLRQPSQPLLQSFCSASTLQSGSGRNSVKPPSLLCDDNDFGDEEISCVSDSLSVDHHHRTSIVHINNAAVSSISSLQRGGDGGGGGGAGEGSVVSSGSQHSGIDNSSVRSEDCSNAGPKSLEGVGCGEGSSVDGGSSFEAQQRKNTLKHRENVVNNTCVDEEKVRTTPAATPSLMACRVPNFERPNHSTYRHHEHSNSNNEGSILHSSCSSTSSFSQQNNPSSSNQFAGVSSHSAVPHSRQLRHHQRYNNQVVTTSNASNSRGKNNAEFESGINFEAGTNFESGKNTSYHKGPVSSSSSQFNNSSGGGMPPKIENETHEQNNNVYNYVDDAGGIVGDHDNYNHQNYHSNNKNSYINNTQNINNNHQQLPNHNCVNKQQPQQPQSQQSHQSQQYDEVTPEWMLAVSATLPCADAMGGPIELARVILQACQQFAPMRDNDSQGKASIERALMDLLGVSGSGGGGCTNDRDTTQGVIQLIATRAHKIKTSITDFHLCATADAGNRGMSPDHNNSGNSRNHSNHSRDSGGRANKMETMSGVARPLHHQHDHNLSSNNDYHHLSQPQSHQSLSATFGIPEDDAQLIRDIQQNHRLSQSQSMSNVISSRNSPTFRTDLPYRSQSDYGCYPGFSDGGIIGSRLSPQHFGTISNNMPPSQDSEQKPPPYYQMQQVGVKTPSSPTRAHSMGMVTPISSSNYKLDAHQFRHGGGMSDQLPHTQSVQSNLTMSSSGSGSSNNHHSNSMQSTLNANVSNINKQQLHGQSTTENTTLRTHLAQAMNDVLLSREQINRKDTEIMDLMEKSWTFHKRSQDAMEQATKSQVLAESRAIKAERDMDVASSEKERLNREVDELRNSLEEWKHKLDDATRDSEELRVELRRRSDEVMELIAQRQIDSELRSRAERMESEERAERIAISAQMIAMSRENAMSERNLRIELDKKDEEWLAKVGSMELRHDEEKEERGYTAGLERECEELKLVLKSRVVRDDEEIFENEKRIIEIARLRGEVETLEERIKQDASAKAQSNQNYENTLSMLEDKVHALQSERRLMHNQLQELRGNIRVYARIRPFLPVDGIAECDLKDAEPNVLPISDSALKTVNRLNKTESSFTYDRVFSPSSSQQTVFDEVSELIQSALDGYQVCLFSYGQTGSGKTHTMQGTGIDQMRGIIPRAIEQIGLYKESLEAEGWKYDMKVSFLEIYNETIRDLLRDDDASNTLSGSNKIAGSSEVLKHDIKVDSDGQRYVTNLNLVQLEPTDNEAVLAIMRQAAKHRSVACTGMNAESSRSHSVFTLHLTAEHIVQKQSLKGILNLVDLAGSERIKRSGVAGENAKEAVSINKSLTSLTDVFVAIGNKSNHVPFRNSKLTYLLQPSLCGDGKTLMVVNLSPTKESANETLCSLKFASQVNKCELGQAKRNLVGGSSNDNDIFATSKSSKKGTKLQSKSFNYSTNDDDSKGEERVEAKQFSGHDTDDEKLENGLVSPTAKTRSKMPASTPTSRQKAALSDQKSRSRSKSVGRKQIESSEVNFPSPTTLSSAKKITAGRDMKKLREIKRLARHVSPLSKRVSSGIKASASISTKKIAKIVSSFETKHTSLAKERKESRMLAPRNSMKNKRASV